MNCPIYEGLCGRMRLVFIGILACTESDNAYFRYSGYLMAWVHAANALAKADVQSFYELHSQLCRPGSAGSSGK